jgi:RHS repeat-associated protein
MNMANNKKPVRQSIRILATLALLLNAFANHGQTYNTQKMWVAQKPFVNEVDIVAAGLPVQDVIQGTEFIDGFGRTVQSVSKQTSPSLQDAVALRVYDNWGRETKKYLPFISGNDGAFKNNALALQTAFNQGMYPGESNFYSQIDLDNSPRNRVLKTYDPGSSWVGSNRGTIVRKVTNTATDNVRIWNIAASPGSLPSSPGAYTAGKLYKTIGTDINGNQSIAYTDMGGHTILKKVQYTTATTDNGSGSPHSGWQCTYYVYDDYSNLRFIIPPKLVALIDGTWTVDQDKADELCFRFEYDDFNRVVIRKNAGTPTGSNGEVWTVYDQRGRIVMTQDGNLRNIHKWQYFQYDSQDRPIATGLMIDPTYYNNRIYHQSIAQGSATYPNVASYTTELLSQTWYDNYNWVASTGSGLGSSLDASNTSNTAIFYAASDNTAPFPQPIVQSPMIRGMVTGSKTEVLESNGTQYLYTVSFYDDHGRVIQAQGTNVSNGIDKATTQYSWTGAPLRVYEQHSKLGTGAQSHNVLTKMNYDHAGRLLSLVKNVSSTIGGATANSNDKTIATYTYKETGQAKTKTLGTSLETQTYDYNVRGWLTGINKNHTIAGNSGNWFGMELGYDKTSTTTGTTNFLNPVYNGSLSGQIWRSKGDGVSRKYDYSYDKANQLTNAGYLQNTSSTTWDKTYMDFSLNSMSYDLNGNIKTLNQNGFVLGGAPNIDNLSYAYLNTENSNRLQHVIDNANDASSKLGDFHYAATSKTVAAVDYSYDYNGNLTRDDNKNISLITYNASNLPNVITFSKGSITYQYDAAGNKLKKTVQENGASVKLGINTYTSNITTVTTYIGGFIYQSKNYSNASLSSLNQPESLLFMAHAEGRSKLKPSGSNYTWVFDYFIRDHLGNIRMTLTDESQTDYYPAATLEAGGMATEQTFYNITNDANHVVTMSQLSWYNSVSNNNYNNNSNNGLPTPPDPTVNPTQASTKMYKLNGATGDRFGMGIALKVMAGDAFNVYGRSLWHNPGGTVNNTSYLVSGVLSTFINAFAGTNAVVSGSKGAATGTLLNANVPTTGNLSPILNNSSVPASTPRANICWILFDEQFKPVQAGSGLDPISTTADAFKPHSVNVNVVQSGYLYIYCSNESNWDVYFDNLQVVHTKGALLNEMHYYPQGLSMYALTSRAYGDMQMNFGYQGKEIQRGEFYDGSGLEEYDFEARYYDPQLGRWHAQDPAGQFASPYNAMANNWTGTVDPDGKWAGWDDVIVGVIGFAVGYVSSGLTSGDWGWSSVQSGLLSAGTFLLGYYTAGGSAGISQGSIANGFSSAGFQSHANTVGLAFAAKTAAASAINSVMPSISIPIGDFTVSASVGLAFSGGGITAGSNFGAAYDDGTWNISAGIGTTNNSVSAGGGVTYKGYGGSYYRSNYGDAIGPDGVSNSQTVGGVKLSFGDVSFRLENDFIFGDGDRWRTNAWELGVGNFVVGSSIYTNEQKKGSPVANNPSSTYGYNQRKGFSAWEKGMVYSSPLWIGYRNGSNVSRFGYSHWKFQDVQQNGMHQSRLFPPGNQNYYLDYSRFNQGAYSHSGYYNPYSLF